MRIVIAGAGIAGLTLAHRLVGHDVVVVDRSPAPRDQGYLIDFFGPGYDAAERLGILPVLRARSHVIDEAGYVDAEGRRVAGIGFGRLSAILGGRLLSILRPDVERTLREALPSGVDLRYGAAVVDVDNRADGVTVRLSDDTVLHADLLVGADGVHSTVRRLVFGDGHVRHLGFHTAAFSFTDPDVHARVAGRFRVTDTVDRLFGCYGLGRDRVTAFTVHRTPSTERPADPRAELRSVFASAGWVVPRALELCPADPYYDHVAQVVVPRWSRDRVVLVGDAAGAVSLIAGQGASLAMGGAYLLADHLDDPPGFERAWRPVVDEKQLVGRSGARWFLPSSPTRLWARRQALRLSRLPMVDRAVAHGMVGRPVSLETPIG
ncbi:FAD-dependent monooxygenase [Saccharothrix violaceirubra]|uniref:2-polyprenyl-6-methoxyphenol hydroxylase-like FAD-dependent oxidoreductase n=1 Tax=Saccharothrix violaceirubra TaxID=413306 RepID=A0A7W7WWS1_9PSEU|nr:FAD-dependent monooxygenase [Saccharothrix violaceirubra]MBB4965883.1 2-polyprenyl-6-methoxyphenol hydroxylase-like FAD-dependent oxidoreductase [Saccharothrix violaceirubra]